MTDTRAGNPLLRPTSLLLAALSLSIGWGIRGNFGHEYGAMVPGALTAIAVCLLSGREDWRRRVAFFGFFGALGWGFGGSISYMHAISYTHSPQYASQIWGFGALFLYGFLWAGMGGAGTALPAVWDRDRLTELFRPLMWIFAFWALLTFGLAQLEQADPATSRHEEPYYWFDSDWLKALTALVALLAFDLWDRRFQGSAQLLGAAAAGLAIGALGSVIAWFTGLHKFIGSLIVRRLAVDETPWDRVLEFGASRMDHTLTPYLSPEAAAQGGGFYVNWPQFLQGITERFGEFTILGAVLGMAAGVAIYFLVYGHFRSGSSLFLHMSLGWLVAFLIMPTLLGWRITPPRSDDWAGISGVFIGMAIYMYRYHWRQVLFTSLVAGTMGGLAFSGATWLKLMMVRIGNPNVGGSDAWSHWQSANWHSFLEQSYGFFNGLAIAIAIALLLTRQAPVMERAIVRRWTEVFSVVFVVLGLTYLNLAKNPSKWIEKGLVGESLIAPLAGRIEVAAESWATIPLGILAFVLRWEEVPRTLASGAEQMVYTIGYAPGTWFALGFIALAIVLVALLRRHLREPLPVIPASPIGKGQLLYLVLLWAMVIGNFERALPFGANRLITEWVIFINAAIVTYLVVVCPRRFENVAEKPVKSFVPHVALATVALLIVGPLSAWGWAASVRAVYDGEFAGHAGRNGKPQVRFGSEAEWRQDPLRTGQDHS